jgi:two-component system chemotaxis response regulator CheB
LNRLRVLIVDDTIVYRKIVGDVMSDIPGVEVVGTANNGKIAMNKVVSLKPDLITLDIEMPEMNGIEVLQQIQEKAPDVGSIVLSTLTHEGGEMTIKALELGAFDFIPKPQSGTMAENSKAVKDLLVPMLKAFARRKDIQNILKGKPFIKREASGKGRPTNKATKSLKDTTDVAGRMDKIPAARRLKSEIIVIGISTGGPNALAKMMPDIPHDIGAPILIVQHMPPIFTKSLAKSLDAKCAIDVREARDGERLASNTALIAPGGKQMKVVAGADGKDRIIRITDDPPENSCKPSVDYLFRSISHHYIGRATGVIMTGMGSDGTIGIKLMKRNGSFIIAQDEDSCTVFGMPKVPIATGSVDVVAPLENIAREITSTVKKLT